MVVIRMNNLAVFLAGPDKIIEVAVNEILVCPESGKPKMVCTDPSRKVFRYKTAEQDEIPNDFRKCCTRAIRRIKN